MKQFVFVLLILAGVCGCNTERHPELTTAEISKVMEKMTDIMVNDVTNPPLASRFFSYACLAGYEIVSQHDHEFKSLHGVLSQYPDIKKPAGDFSKDYQLSAILAMIKTSEKMQPSGIMMEKFKTSFLDSCRSIGFSEKEIERALGYAESISNEILAYAKTDFYNRISNYPRYTPVNSEGSWYPTPPGYFAPVEPYFNTVRPFTLDSCIQFRPSPATIFSTKKNSAFYRLMSDCYEEGRSQSEAHRKIAAFWDCNPFALQTDGHLLSGVKKMSPGAHWIGITGIACKKASTGFSQAMKIHTVVSISLMDGFIACWDEKFRSNRIRPESAIRKTIDPDWAPFLQTPPFPEYVSGHATVSSASAVILTNYFGDKFSYRDTVAQRYGESEHEFSSFKAAAIEAGVSRFYGGIHFMDAIENGQIQGVKIGEWVLKKME